MVVLDAHGSEQRWEVLAVLEFTSSRKRMTAIVREHKSNTIYALCKGADNVMQGRLKNTDSGELWKKSEQALEVCVPNCLCTCLMLLGLECSWWPCCCVAWVGV